MILFRILGKFSRILSRHQKIRIFELGLMMVISGFMEMLSVTMIVPFMEAVMSPQETMDKSYVRVLCDGLNIPDHRSFLVLLGLSMAVLYIIKNLFLLLQMTIQNRFVYNQMFFIQKRLLRSYLKRPYEYYLGIRSGEVMRIIENDTQDAFAILAQLVSFFSEMIVSITLMITVFVIAPVLTAATGVILLVLVLVIQRVSRPVLREAGVTVRATHADMNQWLLQTIQGIKEVKLMRREPFFEERFSTAGQSYVRGLYRYIVLSSAPRFMIEAATMSVMFTAVSVLIYSGTPLESLLPILSGIAMAAVRLLPAASRISGCLSQVAYGEPAVDKLMENLKDSEAFDRSLITHPDEEEERSIRALTDSIRMKGIRYRYPSGSEDVLHDADIEIPRGTSVGIVGASGAGKTTAVDILLGLLQPQNGQVLVDGTEIHMDMHGWYAQIGYIPQTIFMLDGSIRDNVAFGLGQEEIDDEQVWMALREASLEDYVRSLPEGLDTQIGERGVRVSGGQRQRIGIARALYTDPAILVFDEATSALDNETEAAIMDSIDHLHGTKTMIIIAHRLSTIENCDVIYRVEAGKLEKERERS